MAKEGILVVDDDQNICELLRLYIEKEGAMRLQLPTMAVRLSASLRRLIGFDFA